eukprot:maker-scaffold_18-snap-gene-3.3-mRNA-1 protein AED:0.00 eAED:0.00 QI:44/1/1/1/1/1/2/86/369
MGNSLSDTKKNLINPNSIRTALSRQKEKEATKVNVLLYGPNRTGKTALIHQMKLFSDIESFTPEQDEEHKKLIFTHIITGVKKLINDVKTRDSISADAQVVDSWSETKLLSNGDFEILEKTFNEDYIQTILENMKNTRFYDSMKYYFKQDNFKRYEQVDFQPKLEDILWTQKKSNQTSFESLRFDTSLVEIRYPKIALENISQEIFNLLTAIIFVADVSIYDSNAFQSQSIDLFKNFLLFPAVEKVPCILLLNKEDLLREKLAKVPFKVEEGEEKRNEDYLGAELKYDREYDVEKIDDVENQDKEFLQVYYDVVSYLKELYLNQAESEERKKTIYPHACSNSDPALFDYMNITMKTITLKNSLTNGLWM